MGHIMGYVSVRALASTWLWLDWLFDRAKGHLLSERPKNDHSNSATQDF